MTKISCRSGLMARLCPRPEIALLILISLAAFALRAWHHDFDPYHEMMPITDDADPKLRQALKVAMGHWTPHRFHQPYFLIYSTAIVLKLLGKTSSEDFSWIWQAAPLYMVVISVAALVLLYHTTRAIYRRTGTALLAATIFAVVPMAVIGSRYFKEDIPLMFFTNLALYFMVRLLQTRNGRFLLAAGITTGVAISVKYAALLLIPFLLTAHFVTVAKQEKGSRLRNVRHWHLGGAMLLVLVGFLLFNPYVVLDGARFARDVGKQINYCKAGHHTGVVIMASEYLFGYYLRYAVLPGLSVAVTLAAGAGMFLSIRRVNTVACFVFAWVLVFYLTMELSPARPFPFVGRYLHPIYPYLCMFAAVAFAAVFDRARSRVSRGAVVLGTVALLCIPLVKSVIITDRITLDTRFRATEWINDNLEAGAVILLDNPRFSPQPSRQKFQVFHKWRAYQDPIPKLRDQNVDYLVVNSFKYEQFAQGAANSEEAAAAHRYYEELFANYPLVHEFKPRFKFETIAYHNPIIRIYRLSPE